MGHAKNQMMQEQQQGWAFSDRYVCASCVDDYALEHEIVAAREEDEVCSFCSAAGAAPLNVLLEAFMSGIRFEYGDADNEGVGWDGREGGYQWHLTWDTWDLVGEFGDELCGDGLLDAVRDAVEDQTWVQRNFVELRQDEALMSSWEEFKFEIQHRTRFVFWAKEAPEDPYADPGHIPARRILDEVGRMISRLDLLRNMSAGTRWYRTREHASAVEWTAKELGTTPIEFASKPNRMSPAGIPMFYGSADRETAIREVAVRATEPWATAGCFETSAARTVVDLSDLPPVPSLFDERLRSTRRALMFLHRFVEDLRKPAREGWQDLDYVPTQVLTEYLLQLYLDGRVIVGIIYPSAVGPGRSVVLDVDNDACVDPDDPWPPPDGGLLRLGLVSVSEPIALDTAAAR